MEDENSEIADHIAEYARIMKPGGYLIVSVPSPGCFSLQGADELGNSLIRIRTASKWSILNGSIYYRFSSFEDVKEKFGCHFDRFRCCTIQDDCYGLALEYFVFVCQKMGNATTFLG